MKGIYEIQFMKDPLRPGLPASKPTLPNQKDLKLVSLKKTGDPGVATERHQGLDIDG